MIRGAIMAVAVAAGMVAAAPGAIAQRDQPDQSLASILAAAGGYLAQLGRALDGVVFEEDYFQQAQGQALIARRLRSDIAVLAEDSVGWVEFRDTTAVDGKPVPDRQKRITEIFAHPSADALEQARRVVQEGARFNIEVVGMQIDRTINLPMAALMFLRTENQKRSSFSRERSDLFGGRTVVLRFRETAKPRMIGTVDNAAAEGAFWLVPETGRVARTQLILETHRGGAAVTASIAVEYGLVPSLDLWLPKTMDESYQVTSGPARQVVGGISGHAVYDNFRKFNVAVEEKSAP